MRPLKLALHVYLPASEAASGLNVSLLSLPVVITGNVIPGKIRFPFGSNQVIVGVSVDPFTLTEHVRL